MCFVQFRYEPLLDKKYAEVFIVSYFFDFCAFEERMEVLCISSWSEN